MPVLFGYDDHRAFLRDFVAAKRAVDAKYSLAYFSRLIGASESYLKHVVSGVRGLNLSRATALAAKIGLSAVERSFFLTLVMRAQAETEELRAYYDDLLSGLKAARLPYTPEAPRGTVFRDTLAWEIYTLVGLPSFSEEPAWIAATLRRPKLAARRVRACLGDLEASGALKREGGRLVAKDLVLPHGDDVRQTYVLALERAVRYLRDGQDDAVAHFDAFCLVSSDAELVRIKRVLDEARGRIAAIVTAKKGRGKKTRIAFLNVALFPTSV